MGKGHSREVGPPVGLTVDIMLSKYGPECISVLNNWSHEFGFPWGGSLSSNQIQKLEEHLNTEEKKIRGKNRIRTKDLETMDKHKKAFKCWKDESEYRARKRLQGQMTKMKVSQSGDEKRTEKPQGVTSLLWSTTKTRRHFGRHQRSRHPQHTALGQKESPRKRLSQPPPWSK